MCQMQESRNRIWTKGEEVKRKEGRGGGWGWNEPGEGIGLQEMREAVDGGRRCE